LSFAKTDLVTFLAPDWLHVFLTVGIVLAALRLAWVDLVKLEIELETLVFMLVLAVVQAVLYVDIFEVFIRSFAGLAFWGILAFGNRRIPGLGRFGAGDPPLIGVIAFLVAPMIFPWALLAAAMLLATCAWYAYRRGKKPFKSMFPAGPALIASGIIFYLAQWA
jgi:hypothetical protein